MAETFVHAHGWRLLALAAALLLLAPRAVAAPPLPDGAETARLSGAL
jgi:hypothetical protein